MSKNFLAMPRVLVEVDAGKNTGSFDWWRHSLGHGAVNSTPLPERVSKAVKNLKPKLIRIFLQEYFNVYPDHGVFDWSKLDPYMESFANTGAKIVATINFKPPVLFPVRDHSICKPNNVEEYQNLIYQVVKRYSVDKPIVTHWEHANEPDIGEEGGCPFLLPTAEDNYEFYKMLLKPIFEAFPEAKVGGPAMAYFSNPIMKGFIELCHKNNTPLDFVSWHSYTDDPKTFVERIETVKGYVSIYKENKPELMYNEVNKCFDFQDFNNPSYFLISVEDSALESKRASFITTNILTMMETGLDWSMYFLIWDSCMYPDEFATFFSEKGAKGVMYKHWNETPHRFGLFSEGGAARPQYFAYQLLSRMGDEKVQTVCKDINLKTQAVRDGKKLSVIISNYSTQDTRDTIVTVRYDNLTTGNKKLTIYRIDNDRRWDEEKLELIPVEQRRISTLPDFSYQCYCPEDSVVVLILEDEV